MPKARSLNVFIAHASQDKPAVRKLYQNLKKVKWISPWLDEEEILPSMDWDYEIYKAFRDADVIIACLSQESVAKEGYVQREFKRALSYAEEKPEGTIYVIPLRLDECTPPRKLNKYQWVDYFESDAQEKLLKSLKRRAEGLEILEEAIAGNSVRVPSDPNTNRPKDIKNKIYTFADMEFLKIPAGEFWMGADDIDALGGAAKPEHLVYLEYDFYIARFLLTNRQYARERGSVVSSREKINHPVINVSWYDAQKYIEVLNKKYKGELPKDFRFSLPSEAEWEKAARGPKGHKYPWGNTFDEKKCNSKERGLGGTSLVGEFSPQGDSFYRVADMVGNIWEWTRSLLGSNCEKPDFMYPYRFDDEREDESAKKNISRVVRGGSYNSAQDVARCACRHGGYPGDDANRLGFRLCVSPFS